MEFIHLPRIEAINIRILWFDHKAAALVLLQIATSDDPIYQAIRKGSYETAKYFAEKKGKPEMMNYWQGAKRYGQALYSSF